MSKRDVEDYFNQVANQYHDMLQAIKDLEEECSQGLVNPDHLEKMKEMILPLKQNYMRISYIMYLLYKPKRKSKHKKYEEFNKNKLQKIGIENTLSGVKEENEKTLSSFKL